MLCGRCGCRRVPSLNAQRCSATKAAGGGACMHRQSPPRLVRRQSSADSAPGFRAVHVLRRLCPLLHRAARAAPALRPPAGVRAVGWRQRKPREGLRRGTQAASCVKAGGGWGLCFGLFLRISPLLLRAAFQVARVHSGQARLCGFRWSKAGGRPIDSERSLRQVGTAGLLPALFLSCSSLHSSPSARSTLALHMLVPSIVFLFYPILSHYGRSA